MDEETLKKATVLSEQKRKMSALLDLIHEGKLRITGTLVVCGVVLTTTEDADLLSDIAKLVQNKYDYYKSEFENL